MFIIMQLKTTTQYKYIYFTLTCSNLCEASNVTYDTLYLNSK